MKSPNYNKKKTEIIVKLQELKLTDDEINNLCTLVEEAAKALILDVKINQERNFDVLEKYL